MTESTDGRDDACVVALDGAQLAGCLALSKSAHWNQNEADWRLMLELGQGWGIRASDGSLAASTVVLPYGGRFAWVSMVLVLPEHRRKGYATRLLQKALAQNARLGRTSILDATPAGHEVYVQEGFADRWGFKRFSLAAPSAQRPVDGEIRSLGDADWPALLELDRRAFGASRERLLRNLAARLPEAALVAWRGGKPAGFLLGRDGREARQLGPLVADDEKTAMALLHAGLNRVRAPVYVDIADHAPGLQSLAAERGLVFQRPFTRMVHPAGAGPAPGAQGLVFCPAGPELG